MSLYASEKKHSKARQEHSLKKPLKSGDKLNFGALGNKDCKQYIDRENVKLPEKLKYKQVKDKDEKMTSVKKTSSMNIEDKEEKTNKKHRKIGEIELDTGKIEIGYDEDKDKIIVSFVYSDQTQVAREVNEFSAHTTQVYSAEKFQSNDESFYGGAMSIKYNIDKPELAIKEQFDKISKDKNGLTTLDKVIPFNQTLRDKSNIETLRDIKSSNNDDRSNIHKAMSLATDLKNIKEQRKLSFKQKIDSAIRDVKIKSKDTTSTDDSYILYLLKKRLEEEGYLPDDEDDNNKDKDKQDQNVENNVEKDNI